jgi:hypothetical protein
MCSALGHYDQTNGKWIPDFHLLPNFQFINQDDEIKSATSHIKKNTVQVTPQAYLIGEGHENKF